jgi:predicted metalloprotease
LSETKLPGTSGTVLFGRAMLKKALADTANGDMFVMGICAHEFGHIVQYSSGVRTRLTANQQTGKLLELHADFLAGHYIGLRNEKYSPSELVALGRSWQGIGDTAYTDPTHHGTPEERLSAMEQGFRIARDRPQFTMPAICEVGARYLGV